MLTLSDVARLWNISYRQVHNLIDYGYLPVAQAVRTKNNAILYLFSEQEVKDIDIYSCLAEIKDLNLQHKYPQQKALEFNRIRRVVGYYNSFLERIREYPEFETLRICFFLFHLNHYAKSNQANSSALYGLKNQVIRKIYRENPALCRAVYLVGPDRLRITLCEDCKESARAAGMSYPEYIRREYWCSKCYVQSVEKEYYSLVEFIIKADEVRFNFHLPRSRAVKWLTEIDSLPQHSRETVRYQDGMYFYGRPVSKIEEKAFPLSMVMDELKAYLDNKPPHADADAADTT